ncbi:MAG TPA: CDP-alcohol phosphatidyltransferase family protein [Phycisphaerae bacterium]|nr:CDP-alcohol phosphatidyltransferase family protein [Phycisphaerae bacterium]
MIGDARDRDANAPRDDARGAAARTRMPAPVELAPALATLGNVACGMLAALCCLAASRPLAGPSYIAVGCWLVVLAIVLDGLDGRLARRTARPTRVGAMLDSLADVVSFGVAPALLLATATLDAHPPDTLRLALGAVVITYVACAALRLARHHAPRRDRPRAHFVGLPTPGAAAALVSVILVREQGLTPAADLTSWVMVGSAAALAGLAVSRAPYPHLLRQRMRACGRRELLLAAPCVAVLAWIEPALALLALAWVYVAWPIWTALRRDS